MAFRDSPELISITVLNVKELQLLNAMIFPVSYSDKFYKDVVNEKSFSRIVVLGGNVVGGVCCRVEKNSATQQHVVYIMTLACLCQYRRKGIGSIMLNHILTTSLLDPTIVAITLHMKIDNEEALSFYKKFGFVVKETAPAYYKV